MGTDLVDRRDRYMCRNDRNEDPVVQITNLAVPFSGKHPGEGPLSWGQQEIWKAMTATQSAMPVGGPVELPAGMKMRDIVDGLRKVVQRQHTMRTRLRFETDGSSRQVVVSSGEMMLDIFDTEGACPPEVADEAARLYWKLPYDHCRDWPVRIAVIRHHGEPTHLVLVASHVAMDGFGVKLAVNDLITRRVEPVRGLQTLELARWEASPAGRRQNNAALRYIESVLEVMPPSWPNDLESSERSRYWESYFNSPALCLALPIISERTRCSVSAVLLAALALAVARVDGVHPFVVQPISGNRFRPSMTDVACSVAQAGLCLIDVAGLPFDKAVIRTSYALLTSYKYSYVDSNGKDELVRRVVSERGAEYFVDSFFNDRRSSSHHTPLHPPPVTIREFKDAVARRKINWEGPKDNPSPRLSVHFEDLSDTALVSFFIDTHYYSKLHCETLMIEMENVAVEAALIDV